MLSRMFSEEAKSLGLQGIINGFMMVLIYVSWAGAFSMVVRV